MKAMDEKHLREKYGRGQLLSPFEIAQSLTVLANHKVTDVGLSNSCLSCYPLQLKALP
jgi:hypothetical protein